MSSLRIDLRAWIGRMGYTRAQAAEALGLAPTTLAGYLDGGRPCALEGTLRRLMAAIELLEP